MTDPTKADLAEAVARLTEENAELREQLGALYDVCAAALDAAHRGKHPEYVLGYIGQVGAHPDATLSCLRTYAASLRDAPELVALKQEMDPPASPLRSLGCGMVHPGTRVVCELHRDGFHVAPGENEGDPDVEWPIDAAAEPERETAATVNA